MKRNFNNWFSTFRNSIADYKYYVDFTKIYKNVENLNIELNILNSLIGCKNIEFEFKKLISRYPEIINAIPLLIAKREKEIYCQDIKGGYLYKFDYKKFPLTKEQYDQYSYFMKETGLFDLLKNHLINNLIDYVTGVETGLDSNGRKNRGGHLMEDLVEFYIQSSGFTKNINYFKEMYIHEIQEKWKVDLSAISNNGKAEKRFDFVIKTDLNIYVIETNFYTGGGSKLNETARSYKTLANEIDTIDNLIFVWFTDGNGWKDAKNNLEETFDVLETLYNIHDMENNIMNRIFK